MEEKLAPYISRVREATISYSELPDDTVLILQAIYALVGLRLTQGGFSLDDCEALTPQGTSGFIDRLYKQGVGAFSIRPGGVYKTRGDSTCLDDGVHYSVIIILKDDGKLN